MRKIKAGVHQIGRFATNLVRARLLGLQNTLPFICLYYVTYRCNAACSFCSREVQVTSASNTPSAKLQRYKEILVEIRKVTPALYITGGEPLLLRDIEDRLEIAHRLKFHPIAMNTTAMLLDKYPRVLKLLDKLVVSLHTVNPVELANIYVVRQQLAERALDNIKAAARDAAACGTEIMANCVLTPDNIATAHTVLDFCLEHGIQLATVPAVVGQTPMIEIASAAKRRKYDAFIRRVIDQKERDPSSIQGTLMFLDQIRLLERVECRPTSILTMGPDGRVIDPCDRNFVPIGKPVGPDRSVESVLREHFDFSAKFKMCPDNCPKACYLQPAKAMEHPLAAIREYLPFV